MPKKDRTFTDKDVLRIVRAHLDREEQKRVIVALCQGLVVKEIKGDPVILPFDAIQTNLEEAGIVDFVIDLVMAIITRKL